MVGGVITAEAEGGYLLPARRSGRAPNAQGAASALGVLVLPKAAPGALAVKDNRVDSQAAAGGYA